MPNPLDRFKATRHAVQQQFSRDPRRKINTTKHLSLPDVQLAHRLFSEILLAVIASWWDIKLEDGNHRYAKPYCSVHASTTGDLNFLVDDGQIRFVLSGRFYKDRHGFAASK